MRQARSIQALSLPTLALGASGMNMGTRFMATREAPIHDNVKQALVKATELDTRLIMRALRNTERVLRNDAVDRLIEIERVKGKNLKIEDIHDQVAGVYPRVMIEGDMDAGAWSCGMTGVATKGPAHSGESQTHGPAHKAALTRRPNDCCMSKDGAGIAVHPREGIFLRKLLLCLMGTRSRVL